MWTLYQCCSSTKITMLAGIGQHWDKRQHGIERLWQCRSQRWGPTLRQHSHNIAWTLSQCQSPALGATMAQHSRKVAWMFTREWFCHNIHTMLSECISTLWQHCDFVWNTLIECCLDVHITLLGCLKVSTNERHGLMLRHWHNAATTLSVSGVFSSLTSRLHWS